MFFRRDDDQPTSHDDLEYELIETIEDLGGIGGWERTEDDAISLTDGARRILDIDGDDEMTLDAVLERIHPDDRESVSEAIDAADDDGEAFDVSARLFEVVGDDQWIRLAGRPRDDAVQGIVQDITDSRRELDALERVNELLNSTTELAGIGGWEIDAEERELTMTGWMSELLDIEDGELNTEADLIDLIHEDDRTSLEVAIANAFVTAGSFTAEVEIDKPDGASRLLRFRGESVMVSSRPVAVRGTVEEISERTPSGT